MVELEADLLRDHLTTGEIASTSSVRIASGGLACMTFSAAGADPRPLTSGAKAAPTAGSGRPQ